MIPCSSREAACSAASTVVCGQSDETLFSRSRFASLHSSHVRQNGQHNEGHFEGTDYVEQYRSKVKERAREKKEALHDKERNMARGKSTEEHHMNDKNSARL